MTEKNENQHIPVEAFSPGEYLGEEITARGWTQTEFAEIIGRPQRTVNEIVAGKRGITVDTANELAAALGISAQLWLNLESSYKLAKAKPASEAIAHKAKLREKFPVREMIKRGWIPNSKDLDELQCSVLQFFGLSHVDQEVTIPHAARRNYKGALSGIQLAWLFRVKQLADSMPAKPYSERDLTDALPRLLSLTIEPEETRHVSKILAECGVRFVIVEPVRGSKIDGVCFWTNNGKSPAIGMTLRFDRLDNFWFVLRHEIEHVLRGDAKAGLIVDEDMMNADRDTNDEERRANAAAAEFCTPHKELKKFIARVKPYFSEQKIVRFSQRIGRHPGIVVGQLQHNLKRPDLLNKLKPKIRAHVTSSAFTDGWGTPAPL